MTKGGTECRLFKLHATERLASHRELARLPFADYMRATIFLRFANLDESGKYLVTFRDSTSKV
jgi:hypothetical protein